MAILGKIALSLLLLFVCAALIYPTAYAFGMNSTLRTGLQYLQMALALASVGCLWSPWPQGAAIGLAAVLVITAAIVLLAR